MLNPVNSYFIETALQNVNLSHGRGRWLIRILSINRAIFFHLKVMKWLCIECLLSSAIPNVNRARFFIRYWAWLLKWFISIHLSNTLWVIEFVWSFSLLMSSFLYRKKQLIQSSEIRRIKSLECDSHYFTFAIGKKKMNENAQKLKVVQIESWCDNDAFFISLWMQWPFQIIGHNE